MNFEFTIIQYEPFLKETVIDEPPGWDTLDKTVQRDPDTHGIVFNFSEGSLQFIEDAYWIIKEEYLLKGVDGNIGLRIDVNGEVFYSGKLDFNRYQEICGEDCAITIGLDANDSEILVKNRMSTDVDLTSNKAYDTSTTLTNYPGLGTTLIVPSKAILLQAEATNTVVEGDPGYDLMNDADFDDFTPTRNREGYILPKFNNTTITELEDFTPGYESDYVTDYTDTPILTVKTVGIDTGITNYEVTLRFKGSFYLKALAPGRTDGSPTPAQVNIYFDAALYYGPNKTVALAPTRILTSENFIQAPEIRESTTAFDFSWTGTVQLKVGEKIWPVIRAQVQTITFSQFSPLRNLIIKWDKEAFFRVKNFSVTVPTPAKAYLLHEAASRIVENITDNQYHFKSDFYGRTNSQPYSYPANGCGALRALTNGLQLRRAVMQDGSQPGVFISLKKLFDSLKAVDCIGMGIEGKDVRFEPLRYFYNNDIIFSADGVDVITTTVYNERVFNQFATGYEKYETESTNGLDAIHTKRQYRQQIKNTSAALEAYSSIVADGYAIEVTRRKFGSTEDWSYDKEIFFLCLNSSLAVEQGNIISPQNLFDPPTVINYAITPERMALRWYAWLSQGYRLGGNLTFNSGEGNFIARGQLNSTCALEVAPISENGTITNAVFKDPAKAEAFITPEKVSFTYPLGFNEFTDIASKKYGRIQYRQFPGEDWRYGWIDTLKYIPVDGEAEFTLITTR